MLYFLDTETTGNEPAEVIELAFKPITEDAVRTFRFKPVHRMAFGALATHHILPEELEGEQPSAEARAMLPADLEYMVGHNVDYDWNALGRPPCRRICTLAIARSVWPDLDSHSLTALMYATTPPDSWVHLRGQLKKAHGAAQDVLSCEQVFSVLVDLADMQEETWQELWKWSEVCRVPTVWAFGKYKGNPIAGTDKGYLQWCLKQPDMDEYVKVACKEALR